MNHRLKKTVISLCILFSATFGAWGNENSPVLNKAEITGGITARSFEIVTMMASHSQHVVLFEMGGNEGVPAVGRVLLLRKADKPFAAIRVLATYPESASFAGKVLRQYVDQAGFTPMDKFAALEKLSDIKPPPDSTEDKVDLKEIEEALKPEPLAAPNTYAAIDRKQKEGIKGLILETSDIVVRPVRKNGVAMGLAEIRGVFKANDRALLYNAKYRVMPKPSGHFSINLPVKEKETALVFSLEAVSAFGTVEHEEVKIKLPEWTAWQESIKDAETVRAIDAKRLELSPGIGITYQIYEQLGQASLKQFALTPKFSVFYKFAPPSWILGGNAFFTALPLRSNYSDVKFRVFGANIRAGYTFVNGVLGLSKLWRLSLMAGAYYTTTFVSPRTLGYENTTGPQLFPVISRLLEKGGSWSAYFKYSPVSQRLSFLTLSNAELGAGATYTQLFDFGKTPISFTFDFARLSLNTGATGIIHSTSVTVGGAVGF